MNDHTESAGAPAPDSVDALLQIARDIEALKRPCGDDPESATAIQNGRYMGISYRLRALAAPQVAAGADYGTAIFGELSTSPEDRIAMGFNVDGSRRAALSAPQGAPVVLLHRKQLEALLSCADMHDSLHAFNPKYWDHLGGHGSDLVALYAAPQPPAAVAAPDDVVERVDEAYADGRAEQYEDDKKVFQEMENAIQEQDEELQRLKKDAWRWNWVPAFLEEFQIDYCGLLAAVDKSIAEHGDPYASMDRAAIAAQEGGAA